MLATIIWLLHTPFACHIGRQPSAVHHGHSFINAALLQLAYTTLVNRNSLGPPPPPLFLLGRKQVAQAFQRLHDAVRGRALQPRGGLEAKRVALLATLHISQIDNSRGLLHAGAARATRSRGVIQAALALRPCSTYQ